MGGRGESLPFVDAAFIPGSIDAGEAFARGLIEPHATSQLAILTPEELACGIGKLRAAMARGPVTLEADLRVWATVGNGRMSDASAEQGTSPGTAAATAVAPNGISRP